jgi:hypothetical protein
MMFTFQALSRRHDVPPMMMIRELLKARAATRFPNERQRDIKAMVRAELEVREKLVPENFFRLYSATILG